MATRSVICVPFNTNSGQVYRCIYCHWDGYPEHQMPILEIDYGKINDARRLVMLGHLSSLKTDKNWQGESMTPGPLYYYQRGDKDVDCTETTLENLKNHIIDKYLGIEYVYVYKKRRGWLSSPGPF